MSEDNQHVAAAVGIWDLQVVLAPAGKHWMAQAVQIDYAACGDDEEDAKERFEDGLEATLQEHLNIFGNLDAFLEKPAPSRDWLALAEKRKAKSMSFTQVSTHVFEKKEWAAAFPFDGIRYFTVPDTEAA